MATGRINEQGVLVNSKTGKPIGRHNGTSTSISSTDSAVTFNLDDYGVQIPDFPEEPDKGRSKREEEDADFAANSANIPLYPSSDDKPSSSSAPESKPEPTPASPVDKGPTSFPAQRSKYEISPDSYFVVKFGLFQREDGRFVPIKEESVETMPTAELHWVKFRMWNYAEELKWKSEFLEYNPATKTQFLNNDKLNERKIRRLLLDWSFGENDDKMKLLHCDGRLSDESYALFMRLYPSIASTIVDLMNLVLESNQ